ncbi:MAG: hypothetical protein U9R38_01650 [Candidatus Margulisiibacteriota bacterium]|nr:hypothetical protein [Candidatus Margulisiibacteriota bacterium]
MAELDQIYVPALIFTDLKRQRASEISLDKLRFEWNKFHNHFYNLKFEYGVDIVDKFWKEDFDRIEDLISSAEALVMDNKLEEAFQKLEEIRSIFKELRHRNGLPYFLDGMTDFHQTMDEILAYLRGKGELKDKDLKKMGKLSVEAALKWQKVSQAKIDGQVYGFDDAKIKAIRQRISFEAESVEAFKAAVESGDENAIFQSAQDIKPNYIVLYKAFGDFKPIFDEVKKEKSSSLPENSI